MDDNSKLSVIITGATGMVGEGVLLQCLKDPRVTRIVVVGRKSCGLKDQKLAETVVPDFFELGDPSRFASFDACFFCAGVSSIGMSEWDYTRVTYDLTLHFAKQLASVNPAMTFVYVSGRSTDSSEHGRMMWARVKGRTENALARVGFKHTYAFRPGFMRPTPGQRNTLAAYKVLGRLYPLLRRFWPNKVSTLEEVAVAMIEVALKGYPSSILEIADINALAARSAG